MSFFLKVLILFYKGTKHFLKKQVFFKIFFKKHQIRPDILKLLGDSFQDKKRHHLDI